MTTWLAFFPVWHAARATADAGELADVAEETWPIGVRAHRHIDCWADELLPLQPVLATVLGRSRPSAAAPKPDIYRDRRGLKIHHSDLSAFSAELEAAFDTLAARYYLHLRSAPRVTVGRDDIRVRFDVEKED